jgi:hypothetical protein
MTTDAIWITHARLSTVQHTACAPPIVSIHRERCVRLQSGTFEVFRGGLVENVRRQEAQQYIAQGNG